MRAVFTVNLPFDEKAFPTDDFVKRLESEWGMADVIQRPTEEEKKAIYRTLAEDLFAQAPEAVKEELDYVVFFGVVQADRTKFAVIRQTPKQAKFRLLQENLDKLERSAETIIHELFHHFGHSKKPTIVYDEVVIYERGLEHVIITGRVISEPCKETIRTDKKNIFLSLAFSVVLISLLTAFFIASYTYPNMANLVRSVIPAVFAALVISSVSLLQTYFEFKRKDLIDWSVGSAEKKGSIGRIEA